MILCTRIFPGKTLERGGSIKQSRAIEKVLMDAEDWRSGPPAGHRHDDNTNMSRFQTVSGNNIWRRFSFMMECGPECGVEDAELGLFNMDGGECKV